MLGHVATRRLARRITPFVTLSTVWSAFAAPIGSVRADTPMPRPTGRFRPPIQMTGIPTVKKQQSTPGLKPVPLTFTASSDTLLDEVALLSHPIPAGREAAWKAELRTGHASRRRAAKLRIWLGEVELAGHQQPERAISRFREARAHLRHSDSLYGLAAYDTAGALYYEGAYDEAKIAFHRLLRPKRALRGYSPRNCALWLKHASACAGYHAERAKLGIPEPSRLDPLCGVAGLAVCLRGLGLPYQKVGVAAACRYTGEGSTMKDLVDACPKLGVVGRAVSADEKGLVALPKPLVAYVEHDHFIAVVRANREGVTYLCSDCGPWPGGAVTLN